ncbi:MAG: hypothetical protein QXU20_03800 [Candidatus Woesearchaeota archaeon]
MKTILIYLEDKEYEELLKIKNNKTWRELLLSTRGEKYGENT